MELSEEIKFTRNKNIENIVNCISHCSRIPKKELISKNRQRHLVDARKMMYKLIREIYGYPILHIAKHFKKNHATLIHQMREHDKLMDLDTRYAEKFNEIMELLLEDTSAFTTNKMLMQEKEYYKKRIAEINEKLLNEKDNSTKE